jgi:MoxR-like ATPase
MSVNTALVATLNALQKELNDIFPEREDAIEVLFLQVLCKEHSFILGPPGTGKSLLIRTFVGAINGASYYECAMSKNKSDEAVLGPIDLVALRTTGDRIRKRAGFFTDVNLVFIDEIGRMSPILGDDMLAGLNERVRHEVSGNSRSVHPIPLYSAFSAANQLITDDSDESAALWDRLLFRCVVDYLKDKRNFAKMLTASNMTVHTVVDWKELQEAIDTEVPAVKIDTEAMKGLLKMRAELGKDHIRPSDRRWKASLRALQARAYLSGRDTIFEDDLSALRFTLWDTVPQIEKVERLAVAASNPYVDRLMTARDQVREIAQGVTDRKDKAIPEKAAYAKEVNSKLVSVRAELDQLLDDAKGRTIPKFKEVSDLHRATLKNMYIVCFEQDETMAEAAVKTKTGKGDGGQPT